MEVAAALHERLDRREIGYGVASTAFAGLAITIIIGQLPKILGVPSLDGSLPEQLAQLVSELGQAQVHDLTRDVQERDLVTGRRGWPSRPQKRRLSPRSSSN